MKTGVLHELSRQQQDAHLPIVVRAEDVEARPEFRASRSPSEATPFSFGGARAGEGSRQYFTIPAEHGSIRR